MFSWYVAHVFSQLIWIIIIIITIIIIIIIIIIMRYACLLSQASPSWYFSWTSWWSPPHRPQASHSSTFRIICDFLLLLLLILSIVQFVFLGIFSTFLTHLHLVFNFE